MLRVRPGPRARRSPAALPIAFAAALAALGGSASAAGAAPIAVERPLVKDLRSAASIAAGDGITTWTRGDRLWIGGEVRPARRVARRASVRELLDVGRTTAGRKVALVVVRARRDPQVLSLPDGRASTLRLPRQVRSFDAVALDRDRIVFAVDARGAGRPTLWRGRLGERGRVSGLRRFATVPGPVEVTALHADHGAVGVDTYDGRETDENGPRTESFLTTSKGRLRSLGSARETISGSEGTIGIVGLLPRGTGAVVRRVSGSEYGENSTLAAIGRDDRTRRAVVSADPLSTAIYYGWQAGAIDTAGRLIVATKHVTAGQPDEDDAADEPSDAAEVPASILLSGPIPLPKR